MRLRNIEILEKDPNKKGDLFGRLMSDLLHTFGYDEPRLNVHKSGREIDLYAEHRTEPKIAIAECKAHNETIGGSEINKFIGVLDVEKRRIKKEKSIKGQNVIGYFISLSGFKETALEQESDINNERVILVKPEKIVDELIRGRILISKEKAILSISTLASNLTLLNYVDLLAHEAGWIWVFYFSDSNGQEASHFALVHAEGKPLLKNIADKIIEKDRNLKNIFADLSVLNKDNQYGNNEDQVLTRKHYFKYLENELGEIQFEGLPTDKEAGAVKVKLENIFVPLHLKQNQQTRKNGQLEFEMEISETIGNILSENSRLAILAKPGGGKSTLIKRIAIAYAFPERRKQIKDDLPAKNWFPIFLRCRELGERVTHSIIEIINSIPIRAEIPSYSDHFSLIVSEALQNGSALLLIDGLDEISEEKNRILFVNQLRTFIATYPYLNIIVTSREAGFRVVAGSLATYCENYTVANLKQDEIQALCLKWHNAIIDESLNTVNEANKLSEIILKDASLKVLSENPLLLTTLLFVKRWAGYLPTKRSILYQEMIKLLLVTWNVEGHDKLDIEEAEPQLAYIAYWMTKNGQQTISSHDLSNCLIEARRQMPEILGYTKITPSEFIKRVESRSSLLIMTGHIRSESGQISTIYEFLHLSFQEYLTAKAVVKRFIPQIDITPNIIDIVKPNIGNDNWKEVVPLMGVLLERNSKELIEYLIEASKVTAETERLTGVEIDYNLAPLLLGNCLVNEVQISPALLEDAIEWFAKNRFFMDEKVSFEVTGIIINNKFGNIFRRKIKELFFNRFDDEFASEFASTLADIYISDLKNPNNYQDLPFLVLEDLKNGQEDEKCIAILSLMSYFFEFGQYDENQDLLKSVIEENLTILLQLLGTENKHLNFSICWCIAWAGHSDLVPEYLANAYIPHLVKIWMNSDAQHLKRTSSWALSNILHADVPTPCIPKVEEVEFLIQNRFENPTNKNDKLTCILLGILIGKVFSKDTIKEFLNERIKKKEFIKVQLKHIYLMANKAKVTLELDKIIN